MFSVVNVLAVPFSVEEKPSTRIVLCNKCLTVIQDLSTPDVISCHVTSDNHLPIDSQSMPYPSSPELDRLQQTYMNQVSLDSSTHDSQFEVLYSPRRLRNRHRTTAIKAGSSLRLIADDFLYTYRRSSFVSFESTLSFTAVLMSIASLTAFRYLRK